MPPLLTSLSQHICAPLVEGHLLSLCLHWCGWGVQLDNLLRILVEEAAVARNQQQPQPLTIVFVERKVREAPPLKALFSTALLSSPPSCVIAESLMLEVGSRVFTGVSVSVQVVPWLWVAVPAGALR